MKRCTRCGIEKPLTAFQADSRRSDGRKARCKTCVRKRQPVAMDLRGWLGLPDEAGVAVEVRLPRNLHHAPYALSLVRRDPNAWWRWDHVKANGDYWCLTVRVEVENVNVELHWLSHWTRDEARVLDAEMRSARGEEFEGVRLPPAPFSFRPAVGAVS